MASLPPSRTTAAFRLRRPLATGDPSTVTGRARLLSRWVNVNFHNDFDRRNFVSMGAAAGVDHIVRRRRVKAWPADARLYSVSSFAG